MNTEKAMRTFLFFILLFPLAVTGQYQNIMISNQNFPEEPTIMINPYNTDQMVAGANINNVFYSNDRGVTWNVGILTSNLGVWGDPCIIIDTSGHFYFFHLADTPGGNWIDRIVCQKSTDGGASWSGGTYMGLSGTKAQDKEWAVVDPSNNYIYVTWTQFDDYGSLNPLDSSIIRFSRSTDGGETWSDPLRINRVAGDCHDNDSTVEGAVPCMGPNGEIYVSWAGPEGLVFTKSLDQGLTWLATNTFVSDIPGGWEYAIPGIYRANGMPVTCCDLSGGPYHGRIYINWSDQRNGVDDTDIWLVKSDDGGETWSEDIRVNDDLPGKQQFFTWLDIDQTTGDLYFVFYDRRNQPGKLTDVYMAISKDGGETFDNFKVSESPFDPVQSIFFGDYTNISAHDGIIRPIWARLDNISLSVWTALVDSTSVSITPWEQINGPLSLEQNYPNPVREYTCFPYKIYRPSTVSLKLYDIYGRMVAVLVDDKFHAPGKFIERFDLSGYQLSPGFYYVSLTCDEQTLKRKMIME